MPTFGYTTQGASRVTFDNFFNGSNFALPESGDVTSMSAYVNTTVEFESGDTVDMLLAIYDSSDNLLGNSTAETLDHTVDDWVTQDVTANSLSATDYLLIWGFSDTSPFDQPSQYYDTGDVDQDEQLFGYSAPPPDPWTGSVTGFDRKYSIYATYTAAAAAVEDKSFMATSSKFWGG